MAALVGGILALLVQVISAQVDVSVERAAAAVRARRRRCVEACLRDGACTGVDSDAAGRLCTGFANRITNAGGCTADEGACWVKVMDWVAQKAKAASGMMGQRSNREGFAHLEQSVELLIPIAQRLILFF